jgi:anthranilate phosphoribosyltransferase
MLASMEALLRPDGSPALAAAWLVALRMKGETPVEIAAAAEALRSRAERVQIRDLDAIDTCGTGGDGADTFNISTVAAFVVAGAGVTVAKHGNRAVSSRSGSADVLDALGVDLDAPVGRVQASIDEERIGFLFAQRHHPAMKHVGPVRRELGVRTVFNLAGPLSNPAGVRRQLVGVYSAELTESLAQTLQLLGAHKAWVVHGADGLDELSLSTTTRVSELRDGEVRTFTVTPKDAGLERAMVVTLKGGDARENAAIALSILRGEAGPRRDAVLLNAAAALVVADRAENLREGAVLAARAIDSGAALGRLEALLQATGRREGTA